MLNEDEYSKLIEGIKELSNEPCEKGQTVYILPIAKFREFLQQFRVKPEEPTVLDKLNYSYFHERLDKTEQNIATVNNNQAVLKEATSHDFNIVYERLDKMQRHLDHMQKQIIDNEKHRSELHSHHNIWLTSLEQTVMEMKGAMMGQQTIPNIFKDLKITCRCPNPENHHGYIATQKPQREEI